MQGKPIHMRQPKEDAVTNLASAIAHPHPGPMFQSTSQNRTVNRKLVTKSILLHAIQFGIYPL